MEREGSRRWRGCVTRSRDECGDGLAELNGASCACLRASSRCTPGDGAERAETGAAQREPASVVPIETKQSASEISNRASSDPALRSAALGQRLPGRPRRRGAREAAI